MKETSSTFIQQENERERERERERKKGLFFSLEKQQEQQQKYLSKKNEDLKISATNGDQEEGTSNSPE